MARNPYMPILAATLVLLPGQAGLAAAQDVPAPQTPTVEAAPAQPAAPAKDPACAALRAEVSQIEIDIQREGVVMSKQANAMQKKAQARQSAMRATGLLSMIPGGGMLGSLVSRAAGAGMSGMPKDMQASMDRQIALSERMVNASQALHDKCGEDAYGGPPMSPEEIKAMQAEAAAAVPR
ncbi:hypothetical protein OMP43_22015 [Sphingomonas sp. CBMAI 2297]|uniref:hypothetical protein n=1 Tax=Sphingomonas sp. CBMAI 2297 TaxID=2991720 RepID=UPI0024554ABF|nr:hypothetical protein [Sphingomonas sp. CBMAI 2297]MDH4746708.1 hypothetical protein [Sphingomonas sp. CBMAI 2297]